MLARAALAVLIGGACGLAGSGPAVAGPFPPGSGGAGAEIELSIESPDGHLSLTDPAHEVLVHLDGEIGFVTVIVSVDPALDSFYGYLGRLTAPQAPNGVFEDRCSSTSVDVVDTFSCRFDVPIRSGANPIDFVLAAFGIDPSYASGTVIGIPFDARVALEVRSGDGEWRSIDGRVAIPPTATSALSYVLENNGALPFRVDGSCSELLVQPSETLRCPLRGPRPGLALLGDYEVPLTIVDDTAVPVSIVLRGSVDVESDGAVASPTSRGVSVGAVGITGVALLGAAVAAALVLRRRLQAGR